MPQTPSGPGNIAAPIVALPSLSMSMKALRSIASIIALRISALSKGGLLLLTSRLVLVLVGTSWQADCGAWLAISFINWTVTSVGKVTSNLPAMKLRTAVERFGMIV